MTVATLKDQLTRLADRGPIVDARFVVRRAIQIAAADEMLGDERVRHESRTPRELRLTATPGDRRARFRGLGVVAATLLIVAGGAGLFVLRSGVDSPSDGIATAPPTESLPTPPLDSASGPLLTTPVPAEVQPLVSISRAGWTITAFSGFRPVTTQSAPTQCPGCGAARLILAATGSPLGGALFTAWTVDGSYDLNQLDSPVLIGSIAGRATSRGADTSAAQNRMTIAWPLGVNRTAFVDASGLPDAQVIEMAAALTFESEVPAMPARPPGFDVVDPARPGRSVEAYLKFANGESEIELVATNAGVRGLLDWRHPGGHLLLREMQSRAVDGATVVIDQAPLGESPILALDAYWVAGGWGYTAVGHIFESEAEFLEVLTDLRLTDPSTFSAATAGLAPFQLDGFTSPTGWLMEAAQS